MAWSVRICFVLSFILSITTCSENTPEQKIEKIMLEDDSAINNFDSVSFCLRLCDSISQVHYFENILDNPVSPFRIVNSFNNENDSLSEEDVTNVFELSDSIVMRSFSKYNYTYFSYEHLTYGVIYIVRHDHLCMDYLLMRHPLLNENQLQNLITYCVKEYTDRKAEFIHGIIGEYND